MSSSASPSLPSSTCPSLTLVPATPSQARECWTLNGNEWRGPLSLPSYLRREQHLGAQDLMRDGGVTYWILIDSSSPSSSGSSAPVILASCESYRKKALVARRPADPSSQRADVRSTTSHGIGSVFCRAEFRGRGYAARMMDELNRKLRTWQQPDGKDDGEAGSTGQGGSGALFNVLYSDIGPVFYARRGWLPFPSTHVSLAVREWSGASGREESKHLPTQPLHAADLEELCLADAAELRRRMADFRGTEARARVAMVPDAASMRWMHAREDFVGGELGKPDVSVKGVLVHSSPDAAAVAASSPRRVWCIWTHKWSDEARDSTLHVARLVVEYGDEDGGNGEEEVGGIETKARAVDGQGEGKGKEEEAVRMIAACLDAARTEAERTGLAQVELWNPSESALRAARLLDPAAELVTRDEESVASLLWYGFGKDEGEGEVGPEEVEWVANEKYAWC